MRACVRWARGAAPPILCASAPLSITPRPLSTPPLPPPPPHTHAHRLPPTHRIRFWMPACAPTLDSVTSPLSILVAAACIAGCATSGACVCGVGGWVGGWQAAARGGLAGGLPGWGARPAARPLAIHTHTPHTHTRLCSARKLTDEQRSAVANYFAVYKGQEKGGWRGWVGRWVGGWEEWADRQAEQHSSAPISHPPPPPHVTPPSTNPPTHPPLHSQALPSWPWGWKTTPLWRARTRCCASAGRSGCLWSRACWRGGGSTQRGCWPTCPARRVS